jgi:hypothetical protein
VTKEDRKKLREAALEAQRGGRERARDTSSRLEIAWNLQTSNSFRRIGQHGDGDVLCAIKHDLMAPPGVLKYIVAAQPSVVLELLAALDAYEAVT